MLRYQNMVSQYLDFIFEPIAKRLGIGGAELSETIFTEFGAEGIDTVIDITCQPFGTRLLKGLSAIASYLTLLVPGLSGMLDSRTKREIIRMGTHLATQAVEYSPQAEMSLRQAFNFGEALVELNPTKMLNQLVKAPGAIESELNSFARVFGDMKLPALPDVQKIFNLQGPRSTVLTEAAGAIVPRVEIPTPAASEPLKHEGPRYQISEAV